MQAVQITAPAIGGGHALWGGLREAPLPRFSERYQQGQAEETAVYSAHVLPTLGLD